MDSRVRNAADPQQVKKADKEIARERRQELADLRVILKMPEGRRVFHRWIQRLRPLTQLWEPSALLQYKAGRHDVGVEMINAIDQADPNAMLLMLQEAKRTEMEQSIQRDKDEKEKEESED